MVATLGIFLAVLPTLASCRVQPQVADSSWAPARETPVLDQAAQVAVARFPSPTAAPVHPRDILRRYNYQSDATCGYDPFDSNPLYCDGVCNHNSTNGMWGCCYIYEGDTTCYQSEPTTCIDYDWDSTTTSTNSCYYDDDIGCSYTRSYRTLYCSHNSIWSTSGYCMTYLSTSSDTTYSSFLCGNVKTAIKISASEFYTTSSDDPFSTIAAGTGTGSAAGSTTTLTEGEVDRERSGTIGGMVGGAVGGIALVGAVSFAIVFLLARRKRDNASLSSEKQAAFTGNEGGATPTRGSHESPVAVPSQPRNPAPVTATEDAVATPDPNPVTVTGGQDDNNSARARLA